MMLENLNILGIYGAAAVLGAAHALEPGHGKTVVAAYLVGSRGRNIDAVLLGLVVTFTHSFSIILLGIMAKLGSRYYTDQQLHGYLGILASLLILGLGIWLIRSRWRALHGHTHGHGHTHFFHRHHHHHHVHSEHDDTHEHVQADGTVMKHSHGTAHGLPAADQTERVGLTGLILLGISGGIVPCPAALALLLASVSVGELGRGLAIVVIFSLGLAVALVAIGLLVVNSVKVSSKFIDTEKYAPKIAFASAILVTLIGVYTFYSSLSHFSKL